MSTPKEIAAASTSTIRQLGTATQANRKTRAQPFVEVNNSGESLRATVRGRCPLVIRHIRFLRIPDQAHVVGRFSDPLGDDIGMAGAAGI
jgi:hypothetical protein